MSAAGLSAPVAAAMDAAIPLVEQLVEELRRLPAQAKQGEER